MNTHEKIRELIVGFALQELSEEQSNQVKQHLGQCQQCREELKRLETVLGCAASMSQLSADSQSCESAKEAVFAKAKNEQKTIQIARPYNRLEMIWRTIMKSPITKLAAAAVIIVAALLTINIWDNSIPTAYAIEQTIQASHSVRYLHIRNFVASQEEPMEFWVEFDLSGHLKNMRFNKPAWMEPSDGATVIVWKDNKMQLWIKKKNFLVTLKDKEVAFQALKHVEQLDPKFAVERLQQKQDQGKVEIEIDEPSNKTEPIVVTATSLQQKDDSPFQRIVLFVDQATKLVNIVELYQLEDGEYHKVITSEYFDYNQPIDEKMFTLDNLPDDVTRIDQTAQEVGLTQGDLTDKEIAAELVRQFLEALIAQDYAKAGRLFSGTPAERMEKTYGKIRFIRIISIGEPIPHSITGGLYVPCTVEIEENGKIIQWHPEHSYVRQIHGQPERWEIIGGFRGI